MNFKKTIIKSIAFTFALGFIGFLSPQVTKAANAVVFDGIEEKITATGYKFWGLAKEVDEKKKDVTIASKHYKIDELSPIETVGIDLSFLSKSKDYLIAVGTKDDFTGDWAIKEITKQNKDFKAGFLKIEAGKVMLGTTEIEVNKTFKNDEIGAFAAINGSAILDFSNDDKQKVEIKLGKTGNWTQADTFFGADESAIKATIVRLIQNGSELTVRLKGVKQAETTVGAWASKEVKVKIVKQGKAPKLVVDTAKGVVHFKKGQEYKIAIDPANIDDASWTSVNGKKAFTGDDSLNIDGTKKVTIQVRDAATTKKPASKITTVVLTKQDALTVQAITTSGALITDKLNLVMKLPYDIKKGAYIENLTADTYEYAIIHGDTDTDSNTKWLKIKAATPDKKSKTGALKPSKTSLKYSKTTGPNVYSDSNAQAKIHVRLAGTKQNKTDLGAKLSSAVAKAAFNLQNQMGEFTAPDETITIEGNPKKEIVKTYNIGFNKLFKDNTSPKIKFIKRLPGVSVKVSKLTKGGGNGTGTLTVKVSKSAFKTIPSGTPEISFTLTVDGVVRTVVLKFNITQ